MDDHHVDERHQAKVDRGRRLMQQWADEDHLAELEAAAERRQVIDLRSAISRCSATTVRTRRRRRRFTRRHTS